MRLVSMAFMIANLFALLIVASARAAEEPTGFRDIPFGASEAQIHERLPTARCLAVAGDDQHDDVSCSVSSMIGHVPVLVFFRLVGEPMQRRMMNVTLSFKSEDFGRISQAMTDRYGPPTNVSEQRETLRWVGAQTLMFVTKSSSTFGKGLAMIALREFMELAEKRQKEQREKAKKDL